MLQKCDFSTALHKFVVYRYVQRKAEKANAPPKGQDSIINIDWSLMENYWRLSHVVATERIWSALSWLGSSFTEAHESMGGTWDPPCQHDLQNHAAVSVTAPCCGKGPPLPHLQSQSHWSDRSQQRILWPWQLTDVYQLLSCLALPSPWGIWVTR